MLGGWRGRLRDISSRGTAAKATEQNSEACPGTENEQDN